MYKRNRLQEKMSREWSQAQLIKRKKKIIITKQQHMLVYKLQLKHKP